MTQTGSIAPNLHEGSRSEYLAQFIFSSFGTCVPIPHQEDSGLDLYCTLVDRVGHRAWPRAYYSVQVKSSMTTWVFDGPESVRWIVEHPLPIFLCVIDKSEARVLIYHTSPRFAAWVTPDQPNRIELVPGTGTKGQTVDWLNGHKFNLEAPILNFTVQEMLNSDFHSQIAEVLRIWIENDVENLLRVRSGIHHFRVPHEYETNSNRFRGWSGHGGNFRESSLPLAHSRLKELLSSVATHHFRQGDLVSAAIYAAALRQLSPKGYERPFDPHDTFLHMELNKRILDGKSSYLFQACDGLLGLLKAELERHGIRDTPEWSALAAEED